MCVFWFTRKHTANEMIFSFSFGFFLLLLWNLMQNRFDIDEMNAREENFIIVAFTWIIYKYIAQRETIRISHQIEQKVINRIAYFIINCVNFISSTSTSSFYFFFRNINVVAEFTAKWAIINELCCMFFNCVCVKEIEKNKKRKHLN